LHSSSPSFPPLSKNLASTQLSPTSPSKEEKEAPIPNLGYHPQILIGKLSKDYIKEDIAYMPVAFAFHPNKSQSKLIAQSSSQSHKEECLIALGKKKPEKRKPDKKKADKKKVDGKKAPRERNLTPKPKPFIKYDTVGPAPNMPNGWILKTVKRTGGKTRGRSDRYWFSPKTEKRFRSIAEVHRFLSALNDVGGEDENEAWNLCTSRGS